MKNKLPKDWELYINGIENILVVHAREIALQAVAEFYFNDFKKPKKKSNRAAKRRVT